MIANTICKVVGLALLGCLPALANPPYNPNEPAPPPTVPNRPTPSGVPSNGACCGYELTNRNSAYFRYRHEIDFDKLSSLDSVYEAGWEISHGWQVGPSNPSTGRQAIANENNIQLIPGQGLRLKVPGKSADLGTINDLLTLSTPAQGKDARSFSVAEIIFPDIVLGGVIEADMKLTGISGTAFNFMTTHADNTLDSGALGWQDAQVVQMLSNSLLKSAGTQPVGINMKNFEAKTGAMSSSSQRFPSSVNPTTDFHRYSMSWFPSTSSNNPAKMTEIRFDGQLIAAPPKYASVNPQVIAFSHWCNADTTWAGLPPTQDAYVTIKRVVAYYDRPIRMSTGTGVSKDTCKGEKACKVVI